MSAIIPRPESRGSLMAPRSLAEAMHYAEMLARSELVPKDYRNKPANILVAIEWGQEIGLAPMQALSAIAMINGRASVWGDALLALCMRHPAWVDFAEGVEGEGDERHGWCEAERRNRKPVRNTFSVADAKRAGLWNKEGPWRNYPDRMLKLRARAFSLRDLFPDAIRGIYTAEEAADMPPEPREVENLAAHDAPAERPTGPIVAAAGSMLEHAAAVEGREVQSPETAPPAEAGLPLVTLDGVLREIMRGMKSGAPAEVVWEHAAIREVERAEDRGALRMWRESNGPHLAAISEQHPQAVAAVERALEARLFAAMEEPEAEAAPGDDG